MCLKLREFDVIRVDDLKPLWGQELAESLDAGDLVYVRERGSHDVLIVGEGIAVHPQLREAA